MTSTRPPVVPSKNALRILRRLALQSSTIVGAVGSVCGLAAINYDATQRVELAKRIADTKRTLKSFSNGRGAAHVQRMFEAAERGEDFTLDPGKQAQRRKKRSYSALATEKFDTGNGKDDWLTLSVNNTATVASSPALTYTWNAGLPSDPSDLMKFLDSRSSATTTAWKTNTAKKAVHSTNKPIEGEGSYTGEPPLLWELTETRTHARWAPRNSLHGLKELKPHNVSTLQDIHQRHLEQSTNIATPKASLEKHLVDFNHQKHLPTQGEISDDFNFWSWGGQSFDPKVSRQVRVKPEPGPDVAFEMNVQISTEDLSAQLHEPALIIPHEEPGQDKKPSDGIIKTKRKGRSDSRQRVESRPKVVSNSSAAEKIIAATQLQHKVSSHMVYGGTTASKTISKGSIDDVFDSWISPSGFSIDTPSREGDLTTASMLESSFERTGLSLANFPFKPSDLPATDTAYLDRSEFIVENLNFKHDDVSATAFVYGTDTSFSPAANSATLHTSDIQIESSSPMDGQIFMPTFTMDDQVSIHDPGKDTLIANIRKFLSEDRVKEARSEWLKLLDMQTHINTSEQYEELLLLWHQFTHKFGWNKGASHPALRRLAHHLFLEGKDISAAAEILFSLQEQSNESRDMVQIRRLVTTTAAAYLHDIRMDAVDPEAIYQGLQHIIRAAKHRRVPLCEEMFIPVLIHYCSIPDTRRARLIYTEMTHMYNIEPSLHAVSLIITAYAAAGEWDRVRETFEVLHDNSLSRQQPHGYASLFSNVFRIFASQHPIAEVYDFLVHGIGYLGVIPLPSISITLIQACMSSRRYDLMQEWAETVRIMFPGVGILNNNVCWHVAETWNRLEVDCEEIEQTCNALAYRKSGQPFTDRFVTIAREAMAESLARRILAGQAEEDKSRLVGYIEQALASDQTTEILGDTQDLYLKKEIAAASRLERIFKANKMGVFRATKIESPTTKPAISPKSYTETVTSFPKSLTERNLPSPETLRLVIQDYFEDRDRRNLPLDRSILEYVCSKLRRSKRYYDITYLLDNLTTSRGIDVLNAELLTLWLRCALDLRSLIQLRKVFWAALDSCSAIRLTQRFLLLANMGIFRARPQRLGRLDSQESKELAWLFKRLLWVMRTQQQMALLRFQEEGGSKLLKEAAQ